MDGVDGGGSLRYCFQKAPGNQLPNLKVIERDLLNTLTDFRTGKSALFVINARRITRGNAQKYDCSHERYRLVSVVVPCLVFIKTI
jgi:hypothetical protein